LFEDADADVCHRRCVAVTIEDRYDTSFFTLNLYKHYTDVV
jgi:hypothetical protein